MKIFTLGFILLIRVAQAQNIGIGINNPTEKVEVNGNVKANGFTITSGGSTFDFLHKANAAGTVGFKKSHGGMGMNYIICMAGVFPQQNGSPLINGPFLGQIAIVAFDIAPRNWMFCHGQELKIDSNTALYSLLGHTYGGTDSTFRLPDLRGRAPVHPGTSPAGYAWIRGQGSY